MSVHLKRQSTITPSHHDREKWWAADLKLEFKKITIVQARGWWEFPRVSDIAVVIDLERKIDT